MDPTKIVRRSPTPLYVNLTEQMILAQSSKVFIKIILLHAFTHFIQSSFRNMS